MDLNTVTQIVHPRDSGQLPVWAPGDAFLAGGTWLFSEPQTHLRRLIDLASFDWPAVGIGAGGLDMAATCTIAQLSSVECPPDWLSAPLIRQCCEAFLASFKVCKTATVGGNLCLALPAGPMISLTAALDGVCTVWRADGVHERISVMDFVTDAQRTVLSAGDVLRKIEISAEAMRRRSAFRRISLRPQGRSAALLIGSLDRNGAVRITITASTNRPVRLSFDNMPEADELRAEILAIPVERRFHDVNGDPLWRWRMTLCLAEEIRNELRNAGTS